MVAILLTFPSLYSKMTTILRKMFPISPSKTPENKDEDEYNVEYSFASEYSGPSLSYNIPRVVPVNINEIPTASIVSNDSIVNNLSLPIIHPLVKSDPTSNRLLRELKLGYQSPLLLESTSREGEIIGAQIASSGSLGLSDSHSDSQEVSGTSEIEELDDDEDEEGLISEDDHSTIDAFEGEDCVDEGPHHVKKPSIVTFRGPESNVEPILRRPEIKPRLKKGSCYHCYKRNRFLEKEICLVCNAKYCSNCVIRAMGSMPEGRKCITCISYRIDESKREILGKPSRLLRHLLTDLEIKHIMRCEMLCDANRLPPALLYVNEKPLCREEFILLQTCKYPPKKIKPGRFWYDKTAGYWGKEGRKPCQIISADLAIGGDIKQDCSNGKANVVINKRAITKAERRMLQWAGVRCEGGPSFWLEADGILQEEGMNNEITNVWKKSGIQLVCSLLSLPIPPQYASPSKSEAVNGVVADDADQEILLKLLLVGPDESGTTTIFKQARMVHNVRFTDDELENIKSMILGSLYMYLGILLEKREQFEEEHPLEMSGNSCAQPDKDKSVFSLSPRLRSTSDWLVEEMVSGNLEVIFPASSREYAPFVEELLKDRAVQATYNRMNELHMLPRGAKYILDRAVEISRVDYEPTDNDIVYADSITSSNGPGSMEYSFPKPTQDSFMEPAESNDLWSRKYQLTRIHSSSLGENCKWLEMFEDTDLVLYCVSLVDYDQFFQDKNGISINKMSQSKELFENIVNHLSFRDKNFLLIVNNFDLLEEKIEKSPITICEWFYDFDPVISLHPKSNTCVYANPSLAHQAFQYIGMKFKKLFHSLTGRKLYVSMVNELEPKSVEEVLKYAKEILIWEEEKPRFTAHDTSSFSNEQSTSA